MDNRYIPIGDIGGVTGDSGGGIGGGCGISGGDCGGGISGGGGFLRQYSSEVEHNVHNEHVLQVTVEPMQPFIEVL